MKISKDQSLKNYNTFGINVNAKYYVEVFSADELTQVLFDNEYSEYPKCILGSGSNILFTKDFEGLVIKNSIQGITIVDEADNSVIVEAGAGVVWDDLVQYCVANNYGGIENLSLIPGTVGAAPIQNIGAYGQELKETFYELSGIFTETGETRVFDKAKCEFSYRDSIFKRELKNKFFVTSVKLKLIKKPEVNLSYEPVRIEIEKRKIKKPTIKDIREIVISIRKAKLPDPKEIGNAGSFFKNPVVTIEKYYSLKKKFPDFIHYPVDETNVKVPAAWLIEKCGWKGKRVGDTGSYIKQPLVLVNYGKAKGTEVVELADKIRESVQSSFGITLENEVNII